MTSDDKVIEVGGGVRNASERIQSLNQLKQIGLAANNLYDQEGSFPFATSFDSSGRALHGWQTQLLPFMEQYPIYSKIDLNKLWNHADNAAAFRHDIKWIRHPSEKTVTDPAGFPTTTYAANGYALGGESHHKFTDFSQGISNVILAGEASTNLKAWGSPFNVRDPKLGIHQHPDGFGSPLKNSTAFVFLDGSARSFSSSADPEFLEFLTQQNQR